MSLAFSLSIVLAHFIADFPLQPLKLCKKKYSENVRERASGLWQHIFIHFAVVLIAAVHYLWSFWLIPFALIYATIHFALDKFKMRFNRNNLSLFLTDQMLHIACVFLLTLVFRNGITPAPWFNGILSYCKINENLSNIEFLQRFLAAAILLVIGVWAAGVFIRIYMKSIKLENIDNGGAPEGGYIIGILERLLVIMVILTNNTVWTGLILGVKSIARYRKFEKDTFVEYFLIGSFISLLFSFITATLISHYFISLFI